MPPQPWPLRPLAKFIGRLQSDNYLRTRKNRFMKQFSLLFASLLLVAGPLLAQPIPSRAEATLLEHFPLAELIEWGALESGYLVSFYDRLSERAVEMEFDRRGRWVQTTLDFDPEQLNPEIQDYVRANFSQYYSIAYEVRLRKRRQTRYGLVIDTPTHIYTLLFKSNGDLLESYAEGLDGG